MTIEQANKIEDFLRNWFSKGLKTTKNVREKLINAVDIIFERDVVDGSYHDYYVFMENLDDWDLMVWWDDYEYDVWCFDLTSEKQRNYLICGLRIGVQFYIPDAGGGGVVGFTVGYFLRAFDGKIPDDIAKRYGLKNYKGDGSESIWI